MDFKNTLIIMTSNVGSRFILEFDESKRSEMEQAVFEALRATFKPEFLNRIDETIIFHNLSREQMVSIVDIQFARLARRLNANDIDLRLSDNAVKLLSEKGFDPVSGRGLVALAFDLYGGGADQIRLAHRHEGAVVHWGSSKGLGSRQIMDAFGLVVKGTKKGALQPPSLVIRIRLSLAGRRGRSRR